MARPRREAGPARCRAAAEDSPLAAHRARLARLPALGRESSGRYITERGSPSCEKGYEPAGRCWWSRSLKASSLYESGETALRMRLRRGARARAPSRAQMSPQETTPSGSIVCSFLPGAGKPRRARACPRSSRPRPGNAPRAAVRRLRARRGVHLACFAVECCEDPAVWRPASLLCRGRQGRKESNLCPRVGARRVALLGKASLLPLPGLPPLQAVLELWTQTRDRCPRPTQA